jgi:hypothetical protein
LAPSRQLKSRNAARQCGKLHDHSATHINSSK